MPHTYTNGVVTFYEDAGEGPVVVLIHGYGADLRLWDAQVSPLKEAGFRVIRYDVRGHGRSMIAPDGYTFESYAADLRDLLDRLNVERPATESLEVEAIHAVGLSMGGGIGLQFALDYPGRVLSLTLVDSALPGFTYGDETTAHIQNFMEAVRSEGAPGARAGGGPSSQAIDWPISFSIAPSERSSPGETSVIAAPERPARPVRPMRWT